MFEESMPNNEVSEDLKVVLELPKDNPERIENLTLKLAQYRERLEKQKAKNPNVSPEDFTHLEEAQDSLYKISLLSRLLAPDADGKYKYTEVDTEEVAKDLAELYGGLNRKAFNRAVMVIFDYVMTGGNLTKPGMGLKKKI